MTTSSSRWAHVTEALLVPVAVGALGPFLLGRAHADLYAASRRFEDLPLTALVTDGVGWVVTVVGFVVLGLVSRRHSRGAWDVIVPAIGFFGTGGMLACWFVLSLTMYRTGIEEVLFGFLSATLLTYLVLIVWRAVSLRRLRRTGRAGSVA